MSKLFYVPQAVRVDSTGTPYAGCKANFYLTGTTTRTDTYTNSALSVAHDNPVEADAAGQFAPIYLDPAITYRCILTESDDTQIDDVDPVSSPTTAAGISIADAGAYFTATNVETALQEIGSDYGPLADTNTWTADQTYSADIKMADNVLERPEIKDYSLTHTVLTQSSGTVTIDFSTGNSFYFVLTENCTLAFSNPPPTGKFGQAVIRIKQDGAGGAYTVTFPATVDFPSAAAPTMSTGNDAVDKFTVSTDDAGTSYFCEYLQAYG